MAAGTKIRSLSRLLDASPGCLWVIGPTGRLVYLSAGVSLWLGIDVDSLLERRSVAGSPISDDPLDFVAASLSPPPGFDSRGTASLRIQPPPIDGRKIETLDVRFIRLGDSSDPASKKSAAKDSSSSGSLIVAIGGKFDDAENNLEIQDAVGLRKRLDDWRKRHIGIATIATAGVSAAARRMRSRINIATSSRMHVGFFGPQGCGALSIAMRVHHLTAPDESLVKVDGPLMDAELLDATLMPAINQLAESSSSTATVLITDLDDTPIEAQQRLSELIATFRPRLRLLAICLDAPKLLREPLQDASNNESELSLEEATTIGLHPKLVDVLSGMNVAIEPISQRVDDIPVLATAALDARHAAGEGTAERFSRAALDALVIYPWPGNFDELQNVIRHAIQSCPGESIGVEHLPLAVRSYRPGENPVSEKLANVSLDEAVRRYENKIIRDVLESAGGNRAEAARRLGISRARLLRKLDESE